MKVKELIRKLETFDPEMEVVYQCCSDYSEFERDFTDVDVEEIYWLRNDERSKWYPKYLYSSKDKMRQDNNIKLEKAVVFPGN